MAEGVKAIKSPNQPVEDNRHSPFKDSSALIMELDFLKKKKKVEIIAVLGMNESWL